MAGYWHIYLFCGHVDKVVADLAEHYTPQHVSEEGKKITFRADWSGGWVTKGMPHRKATHFMPFCISCGEVINPGQHQRGLLCLRCREKQQEEQGKLVAAGATCTCGKCGSVRPGGFDYATGEIVVGDRVGLCDRCFVGVVSEITAVIENQPGGPLPALVVMAAGCSEERRQAFLAGEEPTEAEFDAAMAALGGEK